MGDNLREKYWKALMNDFTDADRERPEGEIFSSHVRARGFDGSTPESAKKVIDHVMDREP